MTFGFALIIIFLALAAQFESYRDPLIILVSVPMSIAGALVFIMPGFGGASINIYTQVGLVTLMGLISKHGILIVEFANELQHSGRSKREAILEATSIRLRPILMTTAAMVLGVLPLIATSGAGAASRYNMGLCDRLGVVDRHAVHAIRSSCRLSGARREPLRGGACKGDRRFGDRGSRTGINPRRFDIGVRREHAKLWGCHAAIATGS